MMFNKKNVPIINNICIKQYLPIIEIVFSDVGNDYNLVAGLFSNEICLNQLCGFAVFKYIMNLKTLLPQ